MSQMLMHQYGRAFCRCSLPIVHNLPLYIAAQQMLNTKPHSNEPSYSRDESHKGDEKQHRDRVAETSRCHVLYFTLLQRRKCAAALQQAFVIHQYQKTVYMHDERNDAVSSTLNLNLHTDTWYGR